MFQSISSQLNFATLYQSNTTNATSIYEIESVPSLRRTPSGKRPSGSEFISQVPISSMLDCSPRQTISTSFKSTYFPLATYRIQATRVRYYSTLATPQSAIHQRDDCRKVHGPLFGQQERIANRPQRSAHWPPSPYAMDHRIDKCANTHWTQDQTGASFSA